ncbi:hypothetical protein [Tistrella mobilis]|uniref:Uncharacterized protein n=1 Tax=Tistrella mobilis (strain KA081020-065) TaxID=1110502 RepID=I3TWS0_TISMK|nr:hypothetical protein [Tistrella mobilis]AFK57208.1 hypothetical protein TMO_c0598 [Tistrella mobilis KA081020-065]
MPPTMGLLLPTIYVVMSVMVGLCGAGRKPGFVVSFLLSLLVTPFVMLLLLYATRPREPARPVVARKTKRH